MIKVFDRMFTNFIKKHDDSNKKNLNQLKDRYPDFYSLQDYLEYQKHINKSIKSKKLVEYLIDKIIDRQEIECMIQIRDHKEIIFVPVSLIERGMAEKHMQNKNIITVWYLVNRIDIEIEDSDDKVQCFSEDDINDDVIERIYKMYESII